MSKDALGDRMKSNYEGRSKTYLIRRTPAIIRLDGKAFHTFTRGFKKPFDDIMVKAMQETAKYLCENIQGCKIAYTQSDEITLLLTDYDKLTTDAWFDYNVQKMCSIAASMATVAFNSKFRELVEDVFPSDRFWPEACVKNLGYDGLKSFMKVYSAYHDKFNKAMFDARAFNIPKEEVCNCFIWRQQDATRNAIMAVAQTNFSHKEMHKKNCNELQDMLFTQKGINFNDLPTHLKRGSCAVKEKVTMGEAERSRWVVDMEIPIFSKDRDYIERFV